MSIMQYGKVNVFVVVVFLIVNILIVNIYVGGGGIMKIRQGFVSNSSSSSFICDITGETKSGWDSNLTEVQMYQCVNGHTVNESFVNLNDKLFVQKEKEGFKQYCIKHPDKIIYFEDWLENARCELRYELPIEYCPLCIMKEFSAESIKNYFIMDIANQYGLDKETAKETLYSQIRSRFKDYKAFCQFVEGKQQ